MSAVIRGMQWVCKNWLTQSLFHSTPRKPSCLADFLLDALWIQFIYSSSFTPNIVFLHMIFEQQNGDKIHLPAPSAVSLIAIFVKESWEFLLPADSIEVHA